VVFLSKGSKGVGERKLSLKGKVPRDGVSTETTAV
jgi:hypothetical protein